MSTSLFSQARSPIVAASLKNQFNFNTTSNIFHNHYLHQFHRCQETKRECIMYTLNPSPGALSAGNHGAFDRVVNADKSEGGFNIEYNTLEALKIEEPDGLQERPSYHMHLTLHLSVGAKRFSDVSDTKLHSKNFLKTLNFYMSSHFAAPTSVRYSGIVDWVGMLRVQRKSLQRGLVEPNRMQRNPNVFLLNAAQPKSIQTEPIVTQCARPKQRTPQISSCQTWRHPNLFALTKAQPMGYIGYKKSIIACVSCCAFQSSDTFFFIETHKSILGHGRNRTCPLQLSQPFSTTAWLYFR